MTDDGHMSTRLLLHLGVGAGVGAGVTDRILAVMLSALASLAVGAVLEIMRPWLQRRALRLAGRSSPPPPAPPPTTPAP